MWSTKLTLVGRCRQSKGGRLTYSEFASAGMRRRPQHHARFNTQRPRNIARTAHNGISRVGSKEEILTKPTRRWLSAEVPVAEATTKSNGDLPPPEPTSIQLRLVALAQMIPFIGFGVMDNAILIIAGDAIDTSLGVMLGISTMCAAAIGNIISDVAGVMLGTAIEDFVAKYFNLPSPNLTNAQRQLRSVRFANQFGCMVGIVIGCVIGMFPLLWIDPHKIDRMKREKHIETIFSDVVTEAKTLIGAESTCLYVRVSKEDEGKGEQKSKSMASNKSRTVGGKSFEPASDGNYIYAMYRGDSDQSSSDDGGSQPNPPPTSSSSLSGISRRLTGGAGVLHDASDELLPLGRGIVSRAILTRKPWNIYDVHSEPDFIEEREGLQRKVKHMIVVPVLDGHGNAIAAIQATNKLPIPTKRTNRGGVFSMAASKGTEDDDRASDDSTDSSSMEQSGFTDRDVQILVALASHISVSLQRSMYQASDDVEEVRLRDTIRILKEQDGGLTDDDEEERNDKRSKLRTTSYRRHRNLFPED